MSLRPITRIFPYTEATWEESNLNMCLVMTPMEEPIENTKDDMPVSAVPVCLSCGALQPTTTTHAKVGDKILCYICGEISSIRWKDQQEVRDNEELDRDLFNTVEFLTPSEKRAKRKADGIKTDEDACYDKDFDFSTDTIEFRVPVLEPKRNRKGENDERAKTPPNTKERRRHKHKQALEALPPSKAATWEFPALACPPVWWIVVDATVGNSTTAGATRNYWKTVKMVLSKALEEIPPHVHIGLLTATGSRLATWDLSSAFPHVKMVSWTGTDPCDLGLVPANAHYKANIEAAIDAMVESAVSGHFLEDPPGYYDNERRQAEEEKKTDGTASLQNSSYMPLCLTLEILLEFMEQAFHPGLDDGSDDSDDDDDDDDDDDLDSYGEKPTKPMYAGGKILCLLGNPTLETGTPPRDDSMSFSGQPACGLGGLAGACRSPYSDDDDELGFAQAAKTKTTTNTSLRGSKSRNNSTKTPKKPTAKKEAVETDPTDLTPSNLCGYATPLEPETMLSDIGSRCAKAALGVDIIVLVPEDDDDDDDSDFALGGQPQIIPWYGLPLLRPLSDASGAPGPLMFGTSHIESVEDNTEDSSSEHLMKFENLIENILMRTPWQEGMVFGVSTEMRLSRGLGMEGSDIEFGEIKPGQINQIQFLTSGGPATALSTDDGGKHSVEWIMGSCDPHTSFTVDIEIVGEIPDSCEMEGFGEVALRPVIQTCTVFTAIESDGAEPNPNYFTVCKVRVSSVALDLSEDLDDVYNGLDPEALSVVMFNKIAADAYMVGFVQAQAVVEEWLISTMVAIYTSAEAEKAKRKEDPKHENDFGFEFVAGDRLLLESNDDDDEEERTTTTSLEENEKTDILLGEGHFKARFLPLLAYGMMQSDALKPCGKDGFEASMDARLCAIAQMSSMTPTALSKTIAPSLSLWSTKDDRVIVESLPLSREGILEEWEELGTETTKNSVLLLESTQGIFVFEADRLEELGSSSEGRRSTAAPTKKKRRRPYVLGPNLVSVIETAMAVYRTDPAKVNIPVSCTGDLNDLEVSLSDLRSKLVEDLPSYGGDVNYREWRSRIGKSIEEQVEAKGDKPSGKSRLRRLFFGK